jgi:hypothetical protein
LLRVLRQKIGNQPVEGWRHVPNPGRHERRWVVEVSQGDGHVVVADEWRRSCEHFEEHDTERVEIGPGFRLVALDLLGTQILGRAEDNASAGQVAAGATPGFGDTEVGHLDP